MYWITRFFRHLLFCFGADAIKNPEKYAHYARQAKRKTKQATDRLSTQAKCTLNNLKEKESIQKAGNTAKTTVVVLTVAALIALFLSMVFPVFLFFFVLSLTAILFAKVKK